MSITVSLLLFGKCKDFFNQKNKLQVIIGNGSTIQQFLEFVCSHFEADAAALNFIRKSCLISLNLEYQHDWMIELSEGDEVAIIPPVSGG